MGVGMWVGVGAQTGIFLLCIPSLPLINDRSLTHCFPSFPCRDLYQVYWDWEEECGGGVRPNWSCLTAAYWNGLSETQ